MNRVFLFDWGDTLMRDYPAQTGPMWQWPHVSALPGALNVLPWAQTHGRVGIASGASESNEEDIRAALVRVGLARFIDIIFCKKTLGFAKTDPRFWQSIIGALDVPPQQIIMIGDSYAADVAAPQAAGLRAVWFNWRNQPAQSCPTIKTLQELPRLIEPDLLES
ncbi:MAG: putative hydrolase [Proteobacteria bacterium]|nr:putative hydrolase [Pseudomonadota bacterium]